MVPAHLVHASIALALTDEDEGSAAGRSGCLESEQELGLAWKDYGNYPDERQWTSKGNINNKSFNTELS